MCLEYCSKYETRLDLNTTDDESVLVDAEVRLAFSFKSESIRLEFFTSVPNSQEYNLLFKDISRLNIVLIPLVTSLMMSLCASIRV